MRVNLTPFGYPRFGEVPTEQDQSCKEGVMANRTVRVIVIDPKERAITKREHDGSLKSLQKMVGGNVELIRFSDTDCYVNENGMYLAEKHTFTYRDPVRGWTVPLIGTAVLFKLTKTGKEGSCTLSLDTVRERVRWEDHQYPEGNNRSGMIAALR
jgi:hypothetical protein